MTEQAVTVKHKPVKSLWLVVNYNEKEPYRITLETGEESIPIIGHGHHQLSWIIHDLIKERDELKEKLRQVHCFSSDEHEVRNETHRNV